MQLKTSQIKAHRLALLEAQGGLSALSGLPIIEGEAVLDHCHRTGLVRGVITRAENSVLGKVERGKRYGKSFDAEAFASGLHQYLTKEHGDVLHPLHKATPLHRSEATPLHNKKKVIKK